MIGAAKGSRQRRFAGRRSGRPRPELRQGGDAFWIL